MRSGSVRSAEGYCAAIMDFVSNAVLTVYKQRSRCTGGKTFYDVDSYLNNKNRPTGDWPLAQFIKAEGRTEKLAWN